MIGLDTNVLLRYLLQDDPVQSASATQLIEHRLSSANPGFVCTVVAAELAWVLDRTYRFSAAEIAATIEGLLQARQLVVEKEPQVFLAMTALQEGSGSFTDALIAQLGFEAGCAHTLTFDKAAARLPAFALLE